MLRALLVSLTFISTPLWADTEPQMTYANAHRFSFTSIDGEQVELQDLKGKAVLVVNTASQCGLTPQYAGLQKLHEEYGDDGLVVIGVPSDNFGGQEFESEEEVKEFTAEKFSPTFTLTTIQDVKGDDAHPFYAWANKEAGFLGSPKWNFHKYLIDKQGNLAQWFASTTAPDAGKLKAAIEQELAK
jgi:glutathione peroxidase